MHASLSRSGRKIQSTMDNHPQGRPALPHSPVDQIRASYQREGIHVYGFRVVEPQHDSTPHWHLLLFMAPDQSETAEGIMRRYALAEDGDVPGAAEHRFTAVAIDRNRGTPPVTSPK